MGPKDELKQIGASDMPHLQPPADCPSSEALADYLAGVLDGAERAQVEVHVASCPICIEHLAAVGKQLSGGAGRARGAGGEEGASGAEAATLDDLAAAREGVRRGLALGLAQGPAKGLAEGVRGGQGGATKNAGRCPKCDLVNIPGSVYCRECGTVIPSAGLRCHSCRRILPRDSKYCHHCGAPLLGLPPVEAWNKVARWLLRNKWLVAALLSLGVSLDVHKFSAFLVLALIFGLKWAVDLSYAKTLVTIYQSVHRGEDSSKAADLDRTLDKLRRP